MASIVTSLGGAASRGAITVLAGQWTRFVIQLATLAMLARILQPSDFGLYAMVAAIAGLATLLSDFGLSLAAMRSTDLSDQQRSNLFWANVALGFLAAAAVFFAALPLANFYGNPALIGVCQALAITFLAQAASAQLRAELASQLKLLQLTLSDICAAMTSLVAALLVALAGGGVWALVAQQVALTLAQLVYLSIAARWVPRLPRTADGMTSLFKFGLNTGGVQLINYVTANVPTVLLGRFWGPDVVGVYNQAYQLFRVPLQQLAAPMTQVAVPILSRLTSPEQFLAYVQRAQLVLSYVLGGAFLTAAALAIPMLDVLLGPGWEDAPFIFAILAVGGVFQALGYVYYWVFIAKDLTGVQFKYALISRGAMVILIVIALPLGAYGVATASSIGLALNWLILSVFALPHARLDWRAVARVSLKPLLLFGTMFVVVFPIGLVTRTHLPSVLQLMIVAAAAALFLAITVFLVRPIRRDIALIITTVKKAGRKGDKGE